MKKWLSTWLCLSLILVIPITALADNHEGDSATTAEETADLSIATFDVTNGFEQEVDLETLTVLQWTFVKGEATADYSIALPGKQLPATGWKDFYDDLGWDIAQTNVTEITFSDGTKANLYSKVIGDSGKVRFWMDGEAVLESQEISVVSKVVEQGLQLHFATTGYYIIWVNGEEFTRILDNQVIINKYIAKGTNRITIEQTDEQYVSLDTRSIYRLYFEWNREALGEFVQSEWIEVKIPTDNGKVEGPNVELNLQWLSKEPIPESSWYIWLNDSEEVIQMTN